jgi:2-polyprenyl-6-hydroxyphenyl methylase/3-demethylubiquinone-9 3-methyltransferase
MLNFTPQGLAAELFGVLAPFAPPPPHDALPPVLWGSEGHVQKLFGDRVDSLEMRRMEYAETAASPEAYCDLFRKTFGPVVAIYSSLAGQPERTAALDRAFLEFATHANRGHRGGTASYGYEYLLVIARKRRE